MSSVDCKDKDEDDRDNDDDDDDDDNDQNDDQNDEQNKNEDENTLTGKRTTEILLTPAKKLKAKSSTETLDEALVLKGVARRRMTRNRG